VRYKTNLYQRALVDSVMGVSARPALDGCTFDAFSRHLADRLATEPERASAWILAMDAYTHRPTLAHPIAALIDKISTEEMRRERAETAARANTTPA
jgi:hypothetical protein